MVACSPRRQAIVAEKARKVAGLEATIAEMESKQCCKMCLFCGCCGPQDSAIEPLREQKRALEQEMADINALSPWNAIKLKTAEDVAVRWMEEQKSLLHEFKELLLAIQKRTCGTLGFTLQDEWRYLQYDMDKAYVDAGERFPDECPVLPQVVSPHDHAWDAACTNPVPDDRFDGSQLDQLALHRSFYDACGIATAVHPDLRSAPPQTKLNHAFQGCAGSLHLDGGCLR